MSLFMGCPPHQKRHKQTCSWLKEPVPKWNPGKWKHGPKPAKPLLFNFEPYPYSGDILSVLLTGWCGSTGRSLRNRGAELCGSKCSRTFGEALRLQANFRQRRIRKHKCNIQKLEKATFKKQTIRMIKNSRDGGMVGGWSGDGQGMVGGLSERLGPWDGPVGAWS